MKNLCRTYFSIDGEFDVFDVKEKLNINNIEIHTEKNKNYIIIGNNDKYDVDVNKMIRITLKDLFNKIDILNEIYDKYNVKFYLEIVPEINGNSEEVHPILSLDHDIIEFIYLTKTIHDLDYYIY